MPRYLFKAWDRIARMLSGRSALLFLDYDGTLTPIVKRPEQARLSRHAKQLLRFLSNHHNIGVVLVSGRAISDLRKRLPLYKVIFIGNHGLEIEGPQVQNIHPGALKARNLLRKISSQLMKSYGAMAGIFVENKKYTLSVHYRNLPSAKIRIAKRIFMKELRPYLDKRQVMIAEGKKVWEVRPPVKWNKGKAVLKLIGRIKAQSAGPFSIFYVGDDQTDEDAFKVLKGRAVTVKIMSVPEQATKADYFLRSPHEVIDFLERVKKSYRSKEKS